MLLSSLMVEISESIPHSLVEQLKLDNITLTDSAKSIYDGLEVLRISNPHHFLYFLHGLIAFYTDNLQHRILSHLEVEPGSSQVE